MKGPVKGIVPRNLVNPETNAIEEDSVELLCEALGVSLIEAPILVFCYDCQASQMGRFTLEEFMQGMRNNNSETLDELKEVARTEWPQRLSKAETLRPIYRFVFGYALEPDKRFLPVSVAIDYWNLLLRGVKLPLGEKWLKFAETKLGEISSQISRDVWNSILDFLLVNESMESVRALNLDESFWPSVVDRFVGWLQEDE